MVAQSADDLERILAGDAPLPADAIDALFNVDLLRVAALADAARRARTREVVTFVRVADLALEGAADAAIPEGAGECRLAGTPAGLDEALRAVSALVRRAGGRPVTGFSLADLAAIAFRDREPLATGLRRLKDAGLELISEAPIDRLVDAPLAFGAAQESGVPVARVTVHDLRARDGAALVRRLVALRSFLPSIRAIAPLPRHVDAALPTTGYDDVRLVAATRLALRDLERVQVDWTLYGPKLAQVALLCGANDLDAVSAADDDRGPRRSTLEEVRRNITAAALTPVERDGRFAYRTR